MSKYCVSFQKFVSTVVDLREVDDEEEIDSVGSVYYDISLFEGKEDPNEFIDNIVDGGEYGYRAVTTFKDFMNFIEEANGCSIIQRISDEDRIGNVNKIFDIQL